MNFPRNLILGLSLAVVATAIPFTPSAAQTDSVIHLNYGSGSTCDFITPGISISGSMANVIDTQQGYFDVGNSDCPTGGGNTGNVDLSFSTDPPSPATINLNDTLHITWSAVADVCRYDGSSFPAGGSLVGWQTSGYACVGASECLAGSGVNYKPSFDTGGNYSLKLTCLSGGQNGQQATQQFETVSVQVAGGGGPDPGSCVAPPSLTRQLTGTVSKSSGGGTRSGLDVTSWDPVYGFNITTGQDVPWPGVFNTSPKLFVNRGSYWSMAFVVPNNYPYYNTSTYVPYGAFSTNGSNVTQNLTWAVSITEDCGNFNQPASSSDPDYRCFQNYTSAQGGGLSWVVSPKAAPISSVCNLERGKTYHLNVVPGALGTDHSTACPDSTCTINLKSGGNF